MNRTSMQPQSGDPRPTPGHRSAQHPAQGGRYSRRLHDYIQPLSIDDADKRALRARAKFTWHLTDKGFVTPECRWASWIASPVSWVLRAGTSSK